MNRRTAWMTLFTLWPLAAAAIACAADPITLDDFDAGAALSERWTASGPVRAQRADAPADAGVDGVEGRMLRIGAEASAGLFRVGIEPRPAFERGDRFVLRVNAPGATADKPVEFELIALEGRGKARYWRKIVIDGRGWRTVEVPLRWMRPGDGRLPRWDAIDGYGLWLRGGGATLEVDGIEFVPGEREDAAYLTPAQIAEAAFGDAERRIVERGGFVLITDAAALDADKVLDALVQMKASVERDLPVSEELPAARRPAVLVVFEDDADYRAFWPAFAERFAAQIGAPTADGFTALGIASTAYSDKFGAVRPVYVHEAAHALLADRLRLGNRGEWLHEGLATRYTLAVSGQSIAPLVRDALDEPGKRMALDELLSGGPIPLFRYWQAASVIEWLLDGADRAARFGKLVAALGAAGSTDVRPMAEKTLGMTPAQMEEAWLEWARERYAE